MPLVRADRTAEAARDDASIDGRVLLLDLHADEPSRRRHAARDLAAHPQAAAALCERLGIEPAASVRSAILTSLIALRSEAAVSGLLPYLGGEDVALRNAVIEALRQMPDALQPHIRSLLENEDSDVRIFAVNVLAAMAHAEAPRWLEAVLLADPHVNVCAAAVEGLAEVGDAASRRSLTALPTRFPGDPFIAFAVQAALQRIGCA